MKTRKFIKTIPMKLYLLLLALIVFTFFSNDFGLVDIQKTAIILAAGIDKTEDGFSLTTQIAVPKGSDRSVGGTSSVEIQAEGKTVSDCVSLIFSETGWVPKLVFLNLIVLGEDAVKEDVITLLNYFLRNEYMNDSCMLAVCEGKAQDLLSSQSAIDDTSSMAIQKLFSDAAEKSGKVMVNTLKDFAVGYYGVSKSSYLPFLRAHSQKGSQGQSQSAANSHSQQNPPKQEEEKVYTAEETALFSEGKMVALLPREQTLAFSLLKGNVVSGTFNAEDDGKPVTLTVINNKGNVALDMKAAPTLKLNLDVMVRLCCRGTTAPIEDIASDEVSAEILKSAQNNLKDYVSKLYEISKESGCDIFNMKRDLFRSSLKKYEEWKDFLQNSVTVEINTIVKSMK